jgi:hypothetical protein
MQHKRITPSLLTLLMRYEPETGKLFCIRTTGGQHDPGVGQ